MASDAELDRVSRRPPGGGRGPVSHQSLTYLPDEGVLVLTDSKGAAHFYDSTLETLLGSLGGYYYNNYFDNYNILRV